MGGLHLTLVHYRHIFRITIFLRHTWPHSFTRILYCFPFKWFFLKYYKEKYALTVINNVVCSWQYTPRTRATPTNMSTVVWKINFFIILHIIPLYWYSTPWLLRFFFMIKYNPNNRIVARLSLKNIIPLQNVDTRIIILYVRSIWRNHR